MIWGIGTESLGIIGCIFAENGPLECGIELSFSGTGLGAKGDFIRYSYLYPYIFESITYTFCKAHALSYTHSKVGNDQMHIRAEMTSGKWTLSGFVRSRPESLWWFEVDFWHLRVHFRSGPPTIFRKHMLSSMGTECLGIIGCIFAENWPLEGGIESSFSGTGWGAKGQFRWILGSNPCISKNGGDCVYFRSELLTIVRKHMPSGIGTESLGMMGCIFEDNGPLKCGIESSLNGTGWGAKGDFRWNLGPNPCIVRAVPHHFPKAHALRYRHRSLGMIGCIFAEYGHLKGGIESSFSGTGWGAKGPQPLHCQSGPPPFFRKHMT